MSNEPITRTITMTPIDPRAIRVGDRLRVERPGGLAREFIANEWHASSEYPLSLSEASHYLIERPTPAVDLPTEPTEGVLTVQWAVREHRLFGRWVNEGGGKWVESDDNRWTFHRSVVTSFTPTVPLPDEPTRGVLTWTNKDGDERSAFAEWTKAPSVSHESGAPMQMHSDPFGLQVPIERVTSFAPAVVVPVDALEKLREVRWITKDTSDKQKNAIRREVIRGVVRAIDEANR